ncbi:MAG: DUF4286 family protein, partial [Gammaproteobacteria bacterium]
MPESVIYEVSLTIFPGIIDEYDAWLEEHVDAMLEIAGFESAKILLGEPEEDGNAKRVVVYRVRSKEELQSYFHTHATRMRNAGLEKFGDQFSASRRIVPANGYEPPADLKSLVTSEENAHAYPLCANCQTPILGRFCHACGQEDRTYFLSLWDLVGEFTQEILDHDSKLYRSLFPLLFRPGFLTREYVKGRRAHYVRPVRLYLFISIVFFFITAIMTSRVIDEQTGFEINGDEEISQSRINISDDDDNLFANWLENELEEKSKRIKSNPQQFAKDLISNIPIAMFLLLPLFALIMKVLYLFSRRY